MHEAAGLIWSGVAHQKMNWQQAINYCENLGGGARLPTADEYRALVQAMSLGGQYTASLLPETGGRFFWSSSPFAAAYAVYFQGRLGDVFADPPTSRISVRCVRGAAAR
jgi:hypothetical protein